MRIAYTTTKIGVSISSHICNFCFKIQYTLGLVINYQMCVGHLILRCIEIHPLTMVVVCFSLSDLYLLLQLNM